MASSVQNQIRANAQNSQFAMTQIPYHTHNGKDSPPIDISNLINLPTIGNMQTSVYDVAGVDQQLLGEASVQTVTNKRNVKRVVSTTQSATPTINTNNGDIFEIVGLAQNITSMTTNLSGSPIEGDLMEIIFLDNGSAQTISWGSSFTSSLTILPSTTVISTVLRVLLQYQSSAVWGGSSSWVCVSVT